MPSRSRTTSSSSRSLRAEIAELDAAGSTARTRGEALASAALAAPRQQLADWQQRWENFNRDLGAARQTPRSSGPHRAAREPAALRLHAQADRLSLESTNCGDRSRPMRRSRL